MRVVVSEFVPSGTAIVCDLTSFGLDEQTGKLVAFNPEQADAAILVEEILAAEERAPDVLRRAAMIENLMAEEITRAFNTDQKESA